MNKKEYLKNPYSCPNCKGTEMIGEEFEVAGTYVYQEVYCKDCGCIWNDVYHLVDIEITTMGRKQ